MNPERVVQGAGLGAGVRACGPGVDELDDLFHVVYKMGREAYRLEQAAYRAMNQVEKRLRNSARAKDETQRRSIG